MASARGAGTGAMKMHLRSRKRDFASSAAITSSSPSAKSPKDRVVKSKLTSSVGPIVIAPSSPTLTALKKQALKGQNDAKVLLKYPNLVSAKLIRRYKRFLADVVLLNGADKAEKPLDGNSDDAETEDVQEKEDVVTIYVPNTGPMVGLLDEPYARVQLSKSDGPKRKYAYTLEMIQIHNGERHVWVGVHSSSANRMVERALMSRWIPELGEYDVVRREVKFAKNSRVDFVLTTNADDGSVTHEKYVEVKSVTLALENADDTSQRCAVFPDTVSTRAQKHVIELTELLATKTSTTAQESKDGDDSTTSSKVSGAIIFLVQRDDCHEFAPSIQHDKKFAELCSLAAKSGIQLLAYECALEPDETNNCGAVRLLGPLPQRKRFIFEK
ncbi:hypothetical protein PHYBOEH_007660 [Phytophthora boehmeriae]|uniref:Sugar fermentation stimulation protein n=1 Tax=Phytophthora boehmeriae TaxID=109152 RepID=A0A8T1W618_9STRA|nr:hypothetical protein PHYBOEH_007660 [Phytophthora boehmeriae]